MFFFVNLFMNEQMDKDFSLLKYIYMIVNAEDEKVI